MMECSMGPRQISGLSPGFNRPTGVTLCPSFAMASARLTASVVFPTPPLPEPTAIIVSTPGRGCGPCGGCPGRGDMGVFKNHLPGGLDKGQGLNYTGCARTRIGAVRRALL